MKFKLEKMQICDICRKMWQLGWVAARLGELRHARRKCGRLCRMQKLRPAIQIKGESNIEKHRGGRISAASYYMGGGIGKRGGN